jgi:hypothetical protein
MLAVTAVKYKFYKKRAAAVLVGRLRIDKGRIFLDTAMG